MKKWITSLTLLIPAGLAFVAGSMEPGSPSRGELLYENHCRTCHESHIHIKTRSQLSTEREVRYQINRWQHELHLNWNKQEVDEVLYYLDQQYYHFGKRP